MGLKIENTLLNIFLMEGKLALGHYVSMSRIKKTGAKRPFFLELTELEAVLDRHCDRA